MDSEVEKLKAESMPSQTDKADVPSVDSAESGYKLRSGELKEVTAELDGLASILSQKMVNLAASESSIKQRKAEIARLEKLIAEMPEIETLQEKAEISRKDWENALGVENSFRRTFEEAGGDTIGEVREQAKKALEQLVAEEKQLNEQLLEKKGQLAAFSGDNVHERFQEAELEHHEAERRLASVRRKAQAAKKLFITLEESKGRMQEKLLAPIVGVVQPYLSRIFPGSSLAVNEDMEVKGISTGNLSESFDELSGGAREQLSVNQRG